MLPEQISLQPSKTAFTTGGGIGQVSSGISQLNSSVSKGEGSLKSGTQQLESGLGELYGQLKSWAAALTAENIKS